MKKCLLIILACTLPILVTAKHPVVKNFMRDDASRFGTQTWNIGQHYSNIMYFANNSGLLEYDSKNWSIYPIENVTNVRSVLCGIDSQRIYAGAFNEFGYYNYTPEGIFEYTSLLPKMEKKYEDIDEIWNIHQGRKEIYFQSDRYILKYTEDTITTLPFNDKIDCSAYIYDILFITSESTGPCTLNGELFIPIPGAELLKGKKVCAILPYDNTQILFVTNYSGTYIYNGTTIKPFQTGIDKFLIENQVFCAATNGEYIVYGTVQRGIAIQNITNKETMFLNTYAGLQNNTVLSVSFDKQGNLWLGLDKGIDYVILNTPTLEIFDRNNLYGAGYASLLKEKTLYMGTNQGLYSTNYPLKNTPESLELQQIKGIEGQVWHLSEIDNSIFCGNDNGLFIIHDNHRIEKFAELQGTWAVKPMKAHTDQILGCSYQGLFILKKELGKWRFSHFIKGNFKESSGMFDEDDTGRIWFSHWRKGLYRLQLNEKADSIINIEIFDKDKGFPTNRNNTFYKIDNEFIFSSEGGFLKYNAQTDSMEIYHEWNDLFPSPPNSIRLKEAPNGDVWCVSGDYMGLAKRLTDHTYQLDLTTYRALQPKIILGFENLNFIDDHNVIISNEDGFSWVDTKKQIRPNEGFNVLIRDLKVAQFHDSLPAEIRIVPQEMNNNIFASNQNSFRFEYIAPNYQQDMPVRYSCMLDGYEKNWSPFTSENIKEYTFLPKGTYTFRVRAKQDQETTIAETWYTLIILPAWYETQTAYFIYAILICFVTLILFILIKKQAQKAALEMKTKKERELQEQKKRFVADAKDKEREIIELKNQQLQYELRHKSQELANSTMTIIRKNEMLTNLTEGLASLRVYIKEEKSKKSILQDIQRLEIEVKQNIGDDDNWKRFEENFDIVYQNYLKRLSETYPNLNENDKKLCAYLKMGLASKDIASLLNSTIRSVETNRYRLRKKLELDREANLTEFLQRF